MHASELEPDKLKHWETIYAAIEKLLPFRNDIAHNPSTQVAHISAKIGHDNKPAKVLETKEWWEIRTEPKKLLHKPKNRKPRDIKATADDVSQHIKKLDVLLQAISALHWELMGRPPGLGPAIPPPVFPQDMDQW
jgi:hypothetical protein